MPVTQRVITVVDSGLFEVPLERIGIERFAARKKTEIVVIRLESVKSC